MLIQIISHTPLYVWAILAFLIYRGVLAASTREVAFKKLFIIPAVMLALSLQDIGAKFGLQGMPLAAWAAGALCTGLLVWRLGAPGIAAGSTADAVRVRGSWAPLALMMAIFMTKYATAVSMAIQPALAGHAVFMVAVCALFGCFNGYFMGRLARDAATLQRLGAASAPTAAAA